MNASISLPKESANDPIWINPGNAHHLECILKAQRNGQTCLPTWLGLTDSEFALLINSLPGLQHATTMLLDDTALARGDLRQELLDMRRDEWFDIVTLLEQHRHQQDESERLMARIVAAACLGSEHLWRDLGMESREQLRQLLTDNFPELVQRNNKDMRWKKFFYKQLCEQEGGYVCRSPTCEQCPTYHDCFGDES